MICKLCIIIIIWIRNLFLVLIETWLNGSFGVNKFWLKNEDYLSVSGIHLFKFKEERYEEGNGALMKEKKSLR